MKLGGRKYIGRLGEQIAAAYLEKNGYHILEKNYSMKRAEIDIIARKNHVAVFVEVKTRTGDNFGLPEESIDGRKIARIRSAAGSFLKERKIEKDNDIRFDILSLRMDMNCLKRLNRKDYGAKRLMEISDNFCKIEHIKDAF